MSVASIIACIISNETSINPLNLNSKDKIEFLHNAGSYGMDTALSKLFTFLPEGEEEIVASPFAATVSKPLWSQLANFITPAVYAMDDDGVTPLH